MNDDAIQECILKVLKTNTTLQKALLLNAPQAPAIEYYLELNKNGRKKAQDPSTSTLEIMDLLDSINLDDDEYYSSDALHPSLRYGILRESVGKWSK